MEGILIKILNMSLTASYVIMAILVLRLVLKQAPKIFAYALWGVAFFRLACPISFESVFSFMFIKTQPIPKDIAMQMTPQIQSGISQLDQVVNSSLPGGVAYSSVNPLQVYLTIGALVWLLGMGIMIVYSIVKTYRLNRSLQQAVLLEGNIYEMAGIPTPFVFGVFAPKIYLPVNLNSAERNYIICHEQVHIRRLDHIAKPLAFLILCLHWFNPLVWLAFALMSKDMELSCDEKVIKELGSSIKKEYSASLLALAKGNRFMPSPLAFGESHPKSRIKNILNYRKPSLWVLAITAVIVVVAAVGLLANPANNQGAAENPPFQIRVSLEGGEEVDALWRSSQEEPFYREKVPLLQGSSANTGVVIKSDHRLDNLEVFGEITEYRSGAGLTYTQSYNDQLQMADDGSLYLPLVHGGSQRQENIYFFIQYEEGQFIFQVNVPKVDMGDNPALLTIGDTFAELLNNAGLESNPQKIIESNQQLWQKLMAAGNHTLLYCYGEFEKGKQTGLKGELMMRACLDMPGQAHNDLGYNSPQDWYNEFKSTALKIKQAENMAEVEKQLPKTYLLLQMLDGTSSQAKDPILIGDFVYAGEDLYRQLSYPVVMKYYQGYQEPGSFLVPAIQIHGSYGEKDQIKVIATVMYNNYVLAAEGVNDLGGSVIVVALTFTKDGDNYTLEQYEENQDGSYFASSIKEMCKKPISGKDIPNLADTVIKAYNNDPFLEQELKKNLTEHLAKYLALEKAPKGQAVSYGLIGDKK